MHVQYTYSMEAQKKDFLSFTGTCLQGNTSELSVYSECQPEAKSCHFTGATLQNVPINTPLTLTDTPTLFYHTPHPINLQGRPHSLSQLVLFPLTRACMRKCFHHPHFSELKHAAPSPSPTRRARYAPLLEAGE